jgi:hypothetical protein
MRSFCIDHSAHFCSNAIYPSEQLFSQFLHFCVLASSPIFVNSASSDGPAMQCDVTVLNLWNSFQRLKHGRVSGILRFPS